MKQGAQNKRISVIAILLSVVGAAGVISIAAIAPGALGIIRPLARYNRRYQTARYLEGVVGTLQRRGYIKVRYERGEAKAVLTEKGKVFLLRHTLRERTHRSQKWDGKWRLVIFDIHEFKRGQRDRLRQSIVRYGFLRLQNSVWVYPYECEEIVTLLKAEGGIGQEMLYIVSEKIENDGWLKQRFGL